MITHNGQTYRVEVVTPAGRLKYLSIFKNFIYRKMDEGLVDGWQLWQNTVDPDDLAYLASMEAENPKVKRYFIENMVPSYETYDAMRTCEFFKNCHRDDTIYIRFDDDIVWCEEDGIEKMCKARIEHPDALLIYPNVINSTIVSRWHQDIGALGKEAGECNGEYLHEFAYADSGLIELIHQTFQKHFKEGTVPAYYLPSRSFDNYQHFSICSITFWGKDKLVPGSLEEQWLSWERPFELQRPNWFLGDAVVVHFAYHTQRHFIDTKPEYLEFYKQITPSYVKS
jgi:hypothetical protein